jgi:hypothetical protein
MKKEIYGGNYIIYSNGQIWSVRRNRFMSPTINSGGYYHLIISFGKPKTISIHRIVAEAFIPNPNNFPIVNHINGNKLDNRFENLEWCTNRHNITHYHNSKYPGVIFNKGKYDVRIYHNKKNLHIGRFNTIEEAHQHRINFITIHKL